MTFKIKDVDDEVTVPFNENWRKSCILAKIPEGAYNIKLHADYAVSYKIAKARGIE